MRRARRHAYRGQPLEEEGYEPLSRRAGSLAPPRVVPSPRKRSPLALPAPRPRPIRIPIILNPRSLSLALSHPHSYTRRPTPRTPRWQRRRRREVARPRRVVVARGRVRASGGSGRQSTLIQRRGGGFAGSGKLCVGEGQHLRFTGPSAVVGRCARAARWAAASRARPGPRAIRAFAFLIAVMRSVGSALPRWVDAGDRRRVRFFVLYLQGRGRLRCGRLCVGGFSDVLFLRFRGVCSIVSVDHLHVLILIVLLLLIDNVFAAFSLR